MPPEMRERRLLALPSASGSGPVSFARRVRTPTTWPAVHLTRWSKCGGGAESRRARSITVPGHRHLGPLAGVDDEPQVLLDVVTSERLALKTQISQAAIASLEDEAQQSSKVSLAATTRLFVS